MATSGSIGLSTSTEEIIKEALELLGVLGEGEDPTTDQITSSKRTLNTMAKTWQADGLNLFAVQRNYLLLEKGSDVYDLSASTQSTFSTSLVQTDVETAIVESATTVDLVEVSETVSVTDGIAIEIDGQVLFKSTITAINSTTPSLNVDIADAVPQDISAGATVYITSGVANRPMQVLEAYNHQLNSTDIPLKMLSRIGYYELSNKDTTGYTNQVYYDPQIGTGKLYVWPTTDTELNYLILLTQRTLEDFVSDSDEPDYPQEWYMPLAYNLARFLSPKYGIPQMDYSRLLVQARELYDTARGFDTELNTSMFIRPESWGNQRL